MCSTSVQDWLQEQSKDKVQISKYEPYSAAEEAFGIRVEMF